MNVIEIFQELVLNPYTPNESECKRQLPEDIQNALLDQDNDKLKSTIAGSHYLANESHIVQL